MADTSYNCHKMTVYGNEMIRLKDKILENLPYPFFSARDAMNLLGGTQDRRHGIMKRAVAAGEIIRIRRGLYTLAQRAHMPVVNPLVLAQYVYGPSYISLESALRYFDLIPEGVFAITSVSLKKSAQFDTALGLFTYDRVPQEIFYAQVERVESPDAPSILIAHPLKALADYVYVYKKDWPGLGPVCDSLRIEPEGLASVTSLQIEDLMHNYRNGRVKRFLAGLKRDLCL